MQHSEEKRVRSINATQEPIFRHSGQNLFPDPEIHPIARYPYPWEEKRMGQFPKITREFFSCRGDRTRKEKMGHNRFGDPYAYFDCGGGASHGLPMREGEEFIYPIMIDLLNHIQRTFGKQVVVTSGHRCPQHNRYIGAESHSKHMVGAEVDFYVKGMEEQPGIVAQAVMEYYKNREESDLGYTSFIRRQGGWSNKEIALSITHATAERSLDNAFSHPYLTIEVLYDRQRARAVTYNWHTAITYKRY